MDYDFIVIGGGMAGVSVAFNLARGARVCVLESEAAPGLHATGRSAALFAPSYGGPEIRALTRASRPFLHRPPPAFCEQPLLRDRGCLYIASAAQRDRLKHMANEIRASGGRVQTVDKAEALRRVPLLREDYLCEAMLDPDAMDIDVDALHQGFIRGLNHRGGELLLEAAVRKAARKDGVWRIELHDRTVCAPTVINAAGAWADGVAATFGAEPLGLQPFQRTAVIVDAPADVDIRDWPAVIDVDEAFYFKPEAGRLLMSPADETPQPPGDAQPDELDIAIGVDRVQAALRLEVRTIRHSWAGLRTFAPDRAPVVGFDQHVAGFFWSAGQGGYGIQTAPAWGRTAAALARGEPVPEDVAAEGLSASALSPRRFSKARALPEPNLG
jgi:D-arginine dehydrogenase